MPRAKVRPPAARLPYTPLPAGSPEAERVAGLRARATVRRRLEQLIAAGHLDQAVSYALPITMLVDTAPALRQRAEVLRDLTLVDAREDVARALYQQDPARHHASYVAHLRITLQRMTEMLRTLDAEGPTLPAAGLTVGAGPVPLTGDPA